MKSTESLFSFKQKSQDFIVEEQLPFELEWKWDAFFVFFEKRNLNTMDVIDHLCKSLKISRLALGIAWLKDKKAITRQRISIYKSALKKLWWQKKFENCLSEKTTILATNWHSHPIGMSTQIQNIFYIRLRANKNLSKEEKDLTSTKLSYLFNNGFPNLFGAQRFGVEWRNWRQWKAIIDGTLKFPQRSETVFKLQAYASKIFNQYVVSRTKKWLKLMDGDIVHLAAMWPSKPKQIGVYQAKNEKVNVFEEKLDKKDKSKQFFRNPQYFKYELELDKTQPIPTGPVVGYNLLMCPPKSTAGLREQSLLDHYKLNAQTLQKFKEYKIYGIRRSLRVFPDNVKMKFQGDDLLIRFALPSGTYASVLIDDMMARI